jgi:hypothetical protein
VTHRDFSVIDPCEAVGCATWWAGFHIQRVASPDGVEDFYTLAGSARRAA